MFYVRSSFGHFIDTKSMETSSGSDDQINQIMSLLVQKSTDISHLCDLIYHYNKSLGLTYTINSSRNR